jgi:uncharacterized membrane protein YdjX (TVP38/TMEM64 family)
MASEPQPRAAAVWWSAVAIAAALVAVLYFDLQQHLTLEAIQRSRGRLVALYEARPVLMLALFFAGYLAVNALPVPGAIALTLVAGAVLGFAAGVALALVASTIGAAVAFVVCRYLLHDAVQRRFAPWLAAVNEGVRRDGGWYLFALHQAPVMPSFAINLLAALTPLPARRFVWVSALAMLPGVALWVNAGTQVARIGQLSDVMSPAVLASFALLALFPLVASRVVAALRPGVPRGWKKAERSSLR